MIIRINAACTVFEGRVVVSGGSNDNGSLRTVEAYDHVADKWSYMPSMVNGSCGHNMIAISNKLFAIGCGRNLNICEVYDTICKNFVVLSSFPTFFGRFHRTSISFGRKIMVFNNYSSKVAIYDTDTNEWSKKSFKVTKKICNFHCLKFPSVKF